MSRDTTPRTSDAATPTTPATVALASAESQSRRHVLVISDKLVATYALPESGEVRVGRAAQCEILIDDPSISRTHAVITIGATLAIRDLGSANGTRVRDELLVPNVDVEIAAGEPVQVGSATMIVQRQVAPIRPRRLWTHDYFEVRLAEECARAARRGCAFAVMRLSAAADVPAQVLQQALIDLVRLSDVVGAYGPRDYEILLVDTERDEVEAAVRRIADELNRSGIPVRV
ncbi:MAG TPA: FHA domain-containing protein, partial [Kofleriaceae bacterium]